MPDQPDDNGSASNLPAVVADAPPAPFFDDDEDFGEALLDDDLDLTLPETFDDEEEDFDDLADEDGDDGATDARLAQLEAAARELARADVDRHNRRVRRKVSAATTGAGASGLIPVLLSLVGVYDLDPAITAALSTVASLIGAFVVGYLTPERRPSLDPTAAEQILSLGKR
jgi:hypothetical protein